MRAFLFCFLMIVVFGLPGAVAQTAPKESYRKFGKHDGVQPDVTRRRIYLESMERVLGGTDRTVIDTGGKSSPGVLPYLQLNSPSRERPTQQSQSGANQ